MASVSPSAAPLPDAARERVEIILGQIEQLPTLPAVAARLLALITSSRSSARDLVEVIETDQAITSKLLSLVRRADLGVRGEVMGVDRAVVLMGFEAVRNAVLSIQIYETFASVEPHDETDFDRSEFWKHSLAVACAAQMIAESPGQPARGAEAFVCGLLHDIGKMALDACLPKSYARVVRQAARNHRCISDVEREVLGLDHTIAGKRLLSRWKLPKAIVECAWLHHQAPSALPASIESADLIRVVHLADNLARRQRIGFSGYHRVEAVTDLGENLGVDAARLAVIAAELPAQIEKHCQLVGLDRLTSTGLYAEALADANEELGRLNQSLCETNRRLELRSRYFDALRMASANASVDDGVADVCRSAARCIADLLGAERALAFAMSAKDSTLHVGAVGLDDAPLDGPITLPSSAEASPAAPRAPASDRIVPAAECWPAAFERFARLFDDESVWMLPCTHLGAVVGGVLFAAPADAVKPHNRARCELEALCDALGSAIATALARRDAQRLHEELVELNRRLHLAQAELLRARSLSMIAQMAAGAAHELNNPLAVISGRSQMLARHCADERDRRVLEIIHEQCQRATQIVSDLMEFAKPAPPRTADIPLGTWAESLRVRWLARSSLRPEGLVVRLSDPGVTLRGDPDQWGRIFDAILANAVEAMTGSEPRLEINSASTASDDTVIVAVVDNGAGMTADVLEHAVDPFYSHRPAGRGRGLGLSRAARLAENNGGRLWLDSIPGGGTTVYVEVPAARMK